MGETGVFLLGAYCLGFLLGGLVGFLIGRAMYR
jgi:hypothetical protein